MLGMDPAHSQGLCPFGAGLLGDPTGGGERGGGRDALLAGDAALADPEGGLPRQGGQAGQAGIAAAGREWEELREGWSGYRHGSHSAHPVRRSGATDSVRPAF